MNPLPPETLPTASYATFGVFYTSIPNIIAVATIIIIFLLAGAC
jgi:hypothetical protein